MDMTGMYELNAFATTLAVGIVVVASIGALRWIRRLTLPPGILIGGLVAALVAASVAARMAHLGRQFPQTRTRSAVVAERLATPGGTLVNDSNTTGRKP